MPPSKAFFSSSRFWSNFPIVCIVITQSIQPFFQCQIVYGVLLEPSAVHDFAQIGGFIVGDGLACSSRFLDNPSSAVCSCLDYLSDSRKSRDYNTNASTDNLQPHAFQVAYMRVRSQSRVSIILVYWGVCILHGLSSGYFTK